MFLLLVLLYLVKFDLIKMASKIITKISNNTDQMLVEKIKSFQKVCIFSHPNLDLDALGSLTAIYKIAKKYNKNTQIFCWEEIENRFKNYPSFNNLIKFSEDTEIDKNTLLIFTDITDLERTIKAKALLNLAGYSITIDHHILTAEIIENNKHNIFINKQTRSTTELIYEIFKNSQLINISEISTEILMGLLGDTEYLNDFNIDSIVFEIISDLIKNGADYNLIIKTEKRNKDLNKLKAIYKCIERTKLTEDFAYISIDNNLLNDINKIYLITKQDILDEIRCIKDIKFAFVILETSVGFLTCSLKQANGDVELNKIAEKFGGGGHKIASAFRYNFNNDFESEVSFILEEIKKLT